MFNTNSIAFLAAMYPGNGGYYARTQKWSAILSESGYKSFIFVCYSQQDYTDYQNGKRIRFLLTTYIKRTIQCVLALRYKQIIVRREILIYNDYGNLILERLMLLFAPKSILDFDDDIQAAKGMQELTLFGKLLLQKKNKFDTSLKLYNYFIVGSDYLKSKTLKINPKARVLKIPTCVDYDRFPPKTYPIEPAPIRFGWIGTNNNLKYLDIVVPVLNILCKRYDLELVVISGMNYEANCKFPITNIVWSKETEVDSLYKIDIGLMPLFDDEVGKGKCSFKLIQYMGLGIVSIASDVGSNKEVVENEKNGFLVSSLINWEETIENVIKKRKQFTSIGLMSRKRILNDFTFNANTIKYLKFIQENV
jgi:glycosyltransferase involved in cell wall biosynthesis